MTLDEIISIRQDIRRRFHAASHEWDMFFEHAVQCAFCESLLSMHDAIADWFLSQDDTQIFQQHAGKVVAERREEIE